MQQEYTKEQLWKLYEKLPAELKESIFSVETADAIRDTCVRNGIEENQIAEMATLTGNVLLGVLLPEDFQTTLEKELKLKKDTAKKIAQEINRFIFFPVKESLAILHSVGITTPEKPAPTGQEKLEVKSAPTETRKDTVSRQSIKDTYRETTE